MAQRTEKEETEFKVPETITLCVNNCGLTGNPATNNMCQKCFNATTAAAAAAAATASMAMKFSGEKSPRSTTSLSPEKFRFVSESRRITTAADRFLR
ncbi:Zinc finger A20 and AN1 domain-containing stress-associated protein 5, partial [Cucurbita argyrosperma subsp. argyrosperma]